VLIVDSPGRSKHARRDLDRAGSGTERTGDPEAKIGVPVVGGVPVAVRRAEVVWIVVPGTAADDAATRGRPGFQGLGRIEPAAPVMAAPVMAGLGPAIHDGAERRLCSA
jgi:hypothetical protein